MSSKETLQERLYPHPSCKDLRSRTYHSLIHSCAEVSFLYVLTTSLHDWLWIQLTGFYPWTILPSPSIYEAHCTYRYRFTEAGTYIYIHTHTFLYRYIFQFMFFRRSAVLWRSALTENLLPSTEDRVLRHSVLCLRAVLRRVGPWMNNEVSLPLALSRAACQAPQSQSSVTGDSSRCVHVWSRRRGGRGKLALGLCPRAPCDVEG